MVDFSKAPPSRQATAPEVSLLNGAKNWAERLLAELQQNGTITWEELGQLRRQVERLPRNSPASQRCLVLTENLRRSLATLNAGDDPSRQPVRDPRVVRSATFMLKQIIAALTLAIEIPNGKSRKATGGDPIYQDALNDLGEAITLMAAQYSRKQSVNWANVVQADRAINTVRQGKYPGTASLVRSVDSIYNWVADASDRKDAANIRFVTPLKRANFGKLLAFAARNLAAARSSYADAHGKSRKATGGDQDSTYASILHQDGQELLEIANAIYDGAGPLRDEYLQIIGRLRTLTMKGGMVVDRLSDRWNESNDAKSAHLALRALFNVLSSPKYTTKKLAGAVQNAGDAVQALAEAITSGKQPER